MTTVHVYPPGDLIEHDTETSDCPCGPTTQPVARADGSVGWIVVHHSLDGREATEGVVQVAVSWILEHVRDGDEIGWDAEFAYLREHHAARLAKLRESVEVNGILAPVLIGDDGRLWDGHHRLWAAVELGLTSIPATWAKGVDR